jgi:signal transduction histidine kinase
VLREALSNVARHAGASRVEVDVVAADGHIDLSVTDNGIGVGSGSGFGATAPAGGRGLANMRRRAERLGGALTVEPSPAGPGTRVSWRAPAG